jgi:cell division protein FtsI (penicillin-binding protein 3)
MTAAQARAGARSPSLSAATRKQMLRRGLLVLGVVACGFLVIGGQLVRLALQAKPEVRLSSAEPIGSSWSRPDLVDRRGRVLATDVEVHSLFADPAVIADVDEVVEKITDLFRDLDARELRRQLADRTRRFQWIKRGLTPAMAQRAHALGLPGLAFRKELRRAYPAGTLAGHTLGSVNIDNKGLSGLEKSLDESGLAEAVHAPGRSSRAPQRISIDLGVQHAVGDELERAMRTYQASAAAGLVMDARTGEIVAAASLPSVDPSRPQDAQEAERIDRVLGGSYELGSIFKLQTVAMALDAKLVTLETMRDVRPPIEVGPFTIKDPYPQGRALSVREIFLHSSNVGAAMLALEAGADRQKAFLGRLGLLEPGRTEAGVLAPPQVPAQWGKIETITVAYGHGLAVAPVTYAAGLAALVNGGTKVTPTFRAMPEGAEIVAGARLISAETSARMRELMRLNVTHASGTGRRAEIEGYRIGGKTGTAEMAGLGGYRRKAVIASFAAAFPMDEPRYVIMVMLFEPQGTDETKGGITAGLNAAPTTGRIVARIAPILGVLPRVPGVSGEAR